MEQEVRYLRRKVQELESTVAGIQRELRDKLGPLLQELLGARADQIVKQTRVLRQEEAVCRDLLSSCNLFHPPVSQSRRSRVSPAPAPASVKRRRNLSGGGTSSSSGTSSKPGQRTHHQATTINTSRKRGGGGDRGGRRGAIRPKGNLRRPNAKKSTQSTSFGGRGRGGDREYEEDNGEGNESDHEDAEEDEEQNHTNTARIKKEPIGQAPSMMELDQFMAEAEENDNNEFIDGGAERTIVFEPYYGFRQGTSAKGMSSVWEYFLREKTGQFSKCTIQGCEKVFHNRQSTSALRSHLTRMHGINLPKAKPTNTTATPTATATPNEGSEGGEADGGEDTALTAPTSISTSTANSTSTFQ